jgi:hypothetical protein
MTRPAAKRSTENRESAPRHDPMQRGGERNASAPDAEQISRRAYERFEARGGEHGHDQEDWLEAERELRQDRDRGDRTIAGDVDARTLEPRDRDRSER